MSIVKLVDINKRYGDKIIFEKFNLLVEEGEFVSVVGPSGAGKSTLLNIIGMLEKPDSGSIEIDGIKNPTFNSHKGTLLMRNTISYLFQNYGLIDNESVLYNLKTATKFLKLSALEEKQKILDSLDTVGLSDFENKKVYQLSGGEQQRVALAKLILKPSKIILADEPTGSLDSKNRDDVLSILKNLNKNGKTIIMVTHDPIAESYADRHIYINKN